MKRKTFSAKVGKHTYACGARRFTLDVEGIGGVELHPCGTVAQMLPFRYGDKGRVKITVTKLEDS